ncbi:metallophosphoesterase family protein [Arcanobacterium hippocoleae]|uniref:metallophosphoesterase family protein n=1 Tax=Arcanobacterium hippocoleae TaxID=149017 RepID=UPI0033410B30
MRILHTSDWHLGRKFAEYDLTESFIRWGDFLVDLARSEKVDAVLVAGDVYDRSVPGVQMIELFEDILSRLLCTAQVVITSGNHDSATRLGFGAQFLREGLYLQTDSRRSGQPLRLCDKAGNLGAIVYGIPYLDPDVERIRLAPDGVPLARSHFAVLTQACNLIQEDILRSTDIPARVPRIAMAHAFVNGSEKAIRSWI